MEQTISRTLFIRNLPFTCTNEQLETLFSDIGPVKRCFIVKDNDSDNACKGYGYVTFSELDDAKTAKSKIKVFEGRSLHLQYSQPKDSKKKKKAKVTALENRTESVTLEDESTPSQRHKDKKDSSKEKRESVAKQKYTAACTVILSDLPDNTSENDVMKLTKDTKGVESIECSSPNKALVKYSSKAEAVEAAKKLNSVKLKGTPIKVLRQSQEMILTSQKYLQRCKLIVRNLSFQCSEEDLKAAFTRFGNVLQATIPKDPKGKKRGFGFVQFSRLEQASSALKEMNTKPIKGRPVATDWSVPKSKFQTTTSQKETDMVKDKEDTMDKESDEGSFSAEGDVEQGSENDKKEISSTSGDDDEDEDGESDDDNGDHDTSDESEDEKEDVSSDDEHESDSEGGGSSDEGFSEKKASKKRKARELKEDVSEGRTVFIRNLSFESEEEDLEEKFEEFGELEYCRIVVDPNTERSRGTAFVQFKNKEDAEKCLNAASDESQEGIVLDGRKLNVIIAVPRQKATELKQNTKDKNIKDKRNLWLVREGMIRPGTQAAQGLSEADLAKRQKVEQIKRQKLKNPNIFVSTTRLCIRNLPITVDDKKLKQEFLKAAGDKSAVITESRVMRDRKRVNSQGVGKSLGFGFINFKEHKHALEALRSTNNNPELFGDKKRLIVEFSLENKSALLAREKRLERNKLKQQIFKKDATGSAASNEGEQSSGKEKKKRRKREKGKPTDIVKPVPAKTEEEWELRKKTPKGLPTHWGAKVRHKARNAPTNKKQKGNKGGQQKQNLKRKIEESGFTSQIEVPEKKAKKSRNRGRKSEQTDDFDRLVNKYRENLSSAVKAQTKKKGSNWFD